MPHIPHDGKTDYQLVREWTEVQVQDDLEIIEYAIVTGHLDPEQQARLWAMRKYVNESASEMAEHDTDRARAVHALVEAVLEDDGSRPY